MKKPKQIRSSLNIGASAESIKTARESVMSIIKAPDVGDGVKIAALEAMTKICSVNNTTVSNCTFTQEEGK